MDTIPLITEQKAEGVQLRPLRSSSTLGQEQAAALAADLRQQVEGEVRFDAGGRALYATDASNYREIPIGVVLPRHKEDVIKTVALCRQYSAPVLARGGGTSLAGQCCNVAVVLDFSKYMNQVLWVDPEKKQARVQAGVVLDNLQAEAKPYGLVFGPDPATHSHCTIGGMIGNNSCGIHSVMAEFYGPGARTSDNVVALEVLTYDGAVMEVGQTTETELARIIEEDNGRCGEIYSKLRDLRDEYRDVLRDGYPDIPRRVSGYENLDLLLPEHNFNLAQALVGTECTCALVLEATVTLIEDPAARSLLVLGYPDVFVAGDDVPLIREHKPIGLEGMDHLLIHYQQLKEMHPEELELLPDGAGFLLVEFGGDSKADADAKAQALMRELETHDDPPSMKLFNDPQDEEKLWDVRESGLGATARIVNMPDTWPGWEDTAVHPDDVGPYLRDLRKLFDKYEYEASLYGHFGQGLIHCRVTFDLRSADGIRHYRQFLDEAADLVVSYGGTLSGEHGDGQARGELLPKMYSPEMLTLFREFKAVWDPQWKMNPGKIIDADPITADLRLGINYNPWEPETNFAFPADDFSFSRATLRCVGVGKCRREEGGTMCPSYMVTHEETHSTRGRARLLFEMLQGDVVADGWRDDNVKEALDLCLACKGCKGDCPVNVDMATYKAEFFSHYYKGRLRPRSAYAFGLIHWAARLAALAPGLANFFTQTPGLREVAKFAAGIAPQRDIPAFAPQTFREWFQERPSSPTLSPTNRPVILWVDTFNNHFHPEVLKAAVSVLEGAGCEVMIPEGPLCCGRPLYDSGMLGLAKRLWQQILSELRPHIRAGIPVVGLEPSCTAAFRDELINLFPHDEDAQRLQTQTHSLAEFITNIEDYEPPQLPRKAMVHGHCHHRAVIGLNQEEALLNRLGLEADLLDSGCCGMAGSFGFEAGRKYEVSMASGERVLLPAVREAEKDTLIIANGFSCREQIAQSTNRRALHLAQVLDLAGQAERGGAVTAVYPERHFNTPPAQPDLRRIGLVLASLLGSLLIFLRLKARQKE